MIFSCPNPSALLAAGIWIEDQPQIKSRCETGGRPMPRLAGGAACRRGRLSSANRNDGQIFHKMTVKRQEFVIFCSVLLVGEESSFYALALTFSKCSFDGVRRSAQPRFRA
jgi:hypothetical protein